MQKSWDWPGSRWWRVDLHAHSPESHDFGNQSDRDNPDWIRWLRAARDAGIEAVAITDHNTAKAIAHVQDSGSEVVDAPVLFPGVELTAADGTHLLLLMSPDCSGTHIDDLLSTVQVSVDQRGRKEARSTKNIEEILGLIRGRGVDRRRACKRSEGTAETHGPREACRAASFALSRG